MPDQSKQFISTFILILFSLFSFSQEKTGIADTSEVNRLNNLFKSSRSQNPVEAFMFASSALQLAEELNYKKGQATALNNLGVYHKQKGDYDASLQYYKRALTLYEEINHKDGSAKALSNIGNIYSINEDFENALDYYLKAQKIFEELNDTSRLTRILNNLGNVYLDNGQELEAVKYYKEVLDIFENSPNKKDLFDPYSNIGKIFFNRAEYDSALNYFKKSLEYEVKADNKFGIAGSLVRISRLQNAKRNYPAALKAGINAMNLAESVDSKPILMDAYSTLAEIYLHLDDLRNSYLYMNQYHTIKESLFNEKTRKAIAELEKSVELEQKEKEIALLKKEAEISELEYQNSQLYTLGSILLSILLLSLAIVIFLKFKESKKAKSLLEYQNKEILKSKKTLEIQKLKLESWNRNITDSIEYSKSIQEGIMNHNNFENNIPQSFIFYKPKDIVSGDFYWYARKGHIDILVLVDCTGHGVAGAFMTVIANSILNQIVNEQDTTDPATILRLMDSKVMETLKQKEVTTKNHSMDMAICKIDNDNHTLTYAGAKRPLYMVSKGELEEIKGDKYTIGEYYDTPHKEFRNNEIKLHPQLRFYLSSDGFADQFGYSIEKKYMTHRFKNLLKTISGRTMKQQGDSLALEMQRWQGEMEQTDDMLVIGFSLN
ncbi:tetratricopeptide repeat protein [Marivirga sp. S37H4]|uniref:Tetratricopeptide repeat protein n=1 Tax=Marivirga aurantiaca TaxID=2802615 RepID=A0A935C746_9BACT|nr:tetratricopeptide repeat protein [Marivirga aurantiaca]MBK6264714.1 tetratricopeptide repeat protein [Marivirga aurantiaca]